jgi:hypothetical protein
MESNPMLRYLVSLGTRLAVVVLLSATIERPAFAQADAGINERRAGFELEGSWTPVATEDVSNDTIPVDYMALPLNEEARQRALSYSESQLEMVERQCEGWSATYILTGPFGLKVWSDFDLIKGNLISYTIGAWEDKAPLVIWMDGRPHPSRYAEHTRGGFTTGRWEGTTLVTTTTHMKEGFIRKNGPPSSDLATMTLRFYRHGDVLILVGIIEDPIYLAEPLVWTRNFQLSATQLSPVGPPCITTFEGSVGKDVPHYLWGKKPQEFMDELTRKYGVPPEAVLGFPETLYPEYRQKMKAAPRR